MNFIVDALAHPVLMAFVEMILWTAIFRGAGTTQVAGFGLSSYMSYVIWAGFFSRISANWMYEFKMIEEVNLGRINSVLLRPISFYEYYLSQFLGYKAAIVLVSLIIPILIVRWFEFPFFLERLPLVMLMLLLYLVFTYTLSFIVVCSAFFFNRVQSLTVTKNMTLWILGGELFPLDLVPEPYKQYLLNLPFSCGVFVPVGYLTGRLGLSDMIHGFFTIFVGTGVCGLVSYFLWRKAIREYSGTGA
ncbi:MAG: ABC-2 family transporter protein [Pseudobdellovibrionaceae bacterium]